jgi:hypothetical protein
LTFKKKSGSFEKVLKHSRDCGFFLLEFDKKNCIITSPVLNMQEKAKNGRDKGLKCF